jgi:hypothetical protein
MGRNVPTHYLRGNKSEWSPRHVAFFDTETTVTMDGDREIHRLRLWCAQSIGRGTPTARARPLTRSDGRTAVGLAEWITAQLHRQRNLWVFAHNLAFDLSTTRLLTQLAVLGWSMSEFGVTDRNPFFRMVKGSKHLTIVDSFSWLPTKLEAIGEMAGVRKPPLPTWDDDDAHWLVRCYGDVDVTAAAICSLMDWWDSEHLGRWSITGASTGWNAFRHKMPPKAFLVKPNTEARTFERQAIRGGRRDVWRVGTYSQGPYAHLDIERAHATIAERLLLPRQRLGQVASWPLDHRSWGTPNQGLVAWALVSTEAPRYPLRCPDGTWWPSGRFWTVLAGPELAMAHRLGDLEKVGPGYRYLMGHGMRPWGEWVNNLAAGNTADAPEVAYLAAKSWGRAVVGKWAAHTSTSHRVGVALSPTWNAEKAVRADSKTRSTIVDVCGERWWVDHELDADEAFPAVLAWVESELRVRMAAIIDLLGPALVMAVDTDGLVVDLGAVMKDRTLRESAGLLSRSPWKVAQGLCDWVAPLVDPLKLRPTHLYDRVTVEGPQHLTLDDDRRMSGVPKGAKLVGANTYRARSWPKMRWQMRHGVPDGYVRPLLTYRPRGRYARRWVTETHGLVAPQARVTGHLTSELMPYPETEDRPTPNVVPGVQHPTLARLC